MSIGDIAEIIARVDMNPNTTCERCGAKREDGKFITYYSEHGIVCSDCAEAGWRNELYLGIVGLVICIIMPIIFVLGAVLFR